MNSIVATLPFGGSITLWAYMVQATHVILEKQDHYQKQTQRNRLYIHGANGKLLLSIPVKHLGKEGHQHYKDVQIDNSFSWQGQHWKSLEAAYRSSPYFEFYEDEIEFIFQKRFTNLYTFNKTFFKVIQGLLGVSFELSFTQSYKKEVGHHDIRPQQEVKSNPTVAEVSYTQVFADKHGFIPNLSVLDLLFNKGPESLYLLRNCSLSK